MRPLRLPHLYLCIYRQVAKSSVERRTTLGSRGPPQRSAPPSEFSAADFPAGEEAALRPKNQQLAGEFRGSTLLNVPQRLYPHSGRNLVVREKVEVRQRGLRDLAKEVPRSRGC